MTSPERLATRTFLPSFSMRKPTRVGFPSLGSASAMFDRWIGASLVMIPPSWDWDCFWWRRTWFTPRTTALSSFGMTDSTSPVRPLSLPARTTTLSPFLIFCISGSLKHFGGQRDDLHVVLGAKLARNRPEDAGADWLFLVVDQNGRILVETDHAAIGTADVLGRADHDRLHHIALLHAAARNGFLDRDDDDVADRGILPLRAAQHLDAHDTTGAGIVRDVEVCLHLNHDWPPSSFLSGEASPPRSVQNPVYCALASACSA